jgi:hypothetical protein
MNAGIRNIGKIVRAGGIGAGVTAATSAISNAMGPQGAVDAGMHYYERAATLAQWHPTNVGTAALVGGAIGLGVGLAKRNKAYKAEKAQHDALRAEQFNK